MATTIQVKRGTDAARLTITPAIGELVYTTDTKKVYVGDGSTVGGVEVCTGAESFIDLDDVPASYSGEGGKYAKVKATEDGIEFATPAGTGDMTKAVYDSDDDGVIEGANLGAHKDSHDPNDGSDPLDTANAAEIAGVQAAGTGTSHSLARADHAHQIQHGITDNHLLTVDGEPADDEFARFTASGIEGLTVAEAIAALLGAALPENTAMILDAALSADGKYSGIVETGTAGAALAFGDIVYFAVADSKWELAKADAAATSFGKIGICVQAANEDAATTILLWGKVRADAVFPPLTVGAPVFISAATAGDITVTAPTGTTNFVVRIIGYGNTADELYFCPDKTYLELA